jgi:hypothetical protein
MAEEIQEARERGLKKVSAQQKAQDQLSWQERVISGKPEQKASEAAADRAAKPQKNYAEQEAMRKALEELKPPTNSIN